MVHETYSVLFTIHRAQNVPIADFHDLSADPYVRAHIVAPNRPRSPSEPPLRWRTPTVHITRDPVWEDTWLVGGLPSDGFLLELSVIDEDVKDRDDRLGKAEARFTRDMMHEGFEVREKEFKIQKRRGSVLPYIMTYLAPILPGQHLRKHPRIIISAKVVGKTKTLDDSRVYTIGPNAYTQHFSPLIGSMVNRSNRFTKSLPKQETGDHKRLVKASTFVASQLQLTGPTPKELRHHYVGYNYFIKWLYSNSGIAGKVLYQGLRKQYRTIYSHDKCTVYGVVHAKDSDASTSGESSAGSAQTRAFAQQFLHLTGYGEGGRLQTYVLTLDGQWRFSETGDEFAIDFLSKHMMHADGAPIVAYAGEFFVRRIHDESGDSSRQENRSNEPDDDPVHYELIIDNDSGTYRPPQATLPILQAWLEDSQRLGGLGRVTAMDSFDDNLQEMKRERKELKKRLAGGKLPVHKVVKCQGLSARSLNIDGRKMSSREVERVVEEANKDIENKIREGSEKASHDAPNAAMEKSAQRTDSGVHI
ncbi:hypothetical protein EW145_g837 [Phellinidium pouzarii]|uniref:C2 domain-containing protein n=1 Tax=Phellinidium pouzarii TaxID=167371 RepID=A0A4S4LMC8_9AGAM|nr:hypothetical protein EW145_g837 [Phellinidium pouzarii]